MIRIKKNVGEENNYTVLQLTTIFKWASLNVMLVKRRLYEKVTTTCVRLLCTVLDGPLNQRSPLPLSLFPLTLSMLLITRITTVVVFGIYAYHVEAASWNTAMRTSVWAREGAKEIEIKGQRSERPKSCRYQYRRRTHIFVTFSGSISLAEQKKKKFINSYSCGLMHAIQRKRHGRINGWV